MQTAKARAPRNRTLTLSEAERETYREEILALDQKAPLEHLANRIIHQDALQALQYIPSRSIPLIIVDPPYNRTKQYSSQAFYQRRHDDYIRWLECWMKELARIVTETGSIYICSDWQSSLPVQLVAERYFIIRSRITWEREKGRGAKANWKNCSEDIWLCTLSDDYYFNMDAVKMSRKVLAPYRTADGTPKDWKAQAEGNFRLTCPSNLWTDISIPFWSMPENTDHPTQKPEKLIAKLILASSQEGDTVLDPFLGSGTTAVVAQKLGRQFIGIEMEEEYCCIALKRLALAQDNSRIQGYSDGIFWERNTPGHLHNMKELHL